MSRWDITGLFWDDYVAPREPVEKVRRTPPDPVWLAPDYLPHWDQASTFTVPEMTDAEVMALAGRKVPWDTEFYPNYALVGFLDPVTGRVASFEKGAASEWGAAWGDDIWSADPAKMAWIARNVTLVGFNDLAFDAPMLHACLSGASTESLMAAVTYLIEGVDGVKPRPKDFYQALRLTPFPTDHIDLMELAPLKPSLKKCAGRLSSKRMADLPFKPGTPLSPEQARVLRWYWYNDLENTKLLWEYHAEAIALREIITAEYGVDVRSKSDAQIAEAVISTEIKRITGKTYIPRAKIIPGRSFQYRPPAYLNYQSPTMQWVLDMVRRQHFVIDEAGQVITPNDFYHQVGKARSPGFKFQMGAATYTMGIGGLHSNEESVTHVAGDTHEIMDSDVTSYYPSLMIQQGLYPPNVGPEFLDVFTKIKNRRVAAKAAGEKNTAETLKIVLNGTFGKTGERHGRSVVYYPEMMIQVTLSGQLAILLLIERLELAGIPVISANTDGLVTKCPLDLRETRDGIMKQWERDTGLELEHKRYKAVYSRDVNAYIALLEKPDPKDKTPFRYAKAVGPYRRILGVQPLKWEPKCEIVQEAVVEFLATGRPVTETIRACDDVRKFVKVGLVTGGGVKDGQYLGKVVRWYYSTDCPGSIVKAVNGNFVAETEGARPCMDLPEGLPADLDHAWYEEKARTILAGFGPEVQKMLPDPIAIAAE